MSEERNITSNKKQSQSEITDGFYRFFHSLHTDGKMACCFMVYIDWTMWNIIKKTIKILN